MGLNKPKWAQNINSKYIESDPIWAHNGPIWAQMR